MIPQQKNQKVHFQDSEDLQTQMFKNIDPNSAFDSLSGKKNRKTGGQLAGNKKEKKTVNFNSVKESVCLKKFQALVHSEVSIIDLKAFLIELYRGSKYSVKSLKKPSPDQIKEKKVELEGIGQSKKKLLLLDLDQTIIYCQKQNIAEVSQEESVYNLYFRPHLYRFLKKISEYYEIFVFTASTKSYAEQITQRINGSNNFIKGVLSREHCFETKKGNMLKDLRIISNRSLKDIVIIDNKVESFGGQLDNGIPIFQFRGSKDDVELKCLEPTLIELSQVYDVRNYIREKFDLGLLANIEKEDVQLYLKKELKSGISAKNLKMHVGEQDA